MFEAASADKVVLSKLTHCWDTHGGEPCTKNIPEAAKCLPDKD